MAYELAEIIYFIEQSALRRSKFPSISAFVVIGDSGMRNGKSQDLNVLSEGISLPSHFKLTGSKGSSASLV